MKDAPSDHVLGFGEDDDTKNGVDTASTGLDNKETTESRDLEKTESVQAHHDHDDEDDGDGSTISESSSTPVRSRHGSQQASRVQSRTSVTEVRDGIQNLRDPEIGYPIQEKVTTTAPNPDDPDLVTWTGPDDPENPKNWRFRTKWGAVFVVSVFTFISPVSSSMVAPSLHAIGEELNVPEGFQQAIVLSVFVLAYAVGPLLYAQDLPSPETPPPPPLTLET